jgi:hypothetical protein
LLRNLCLLLLTVFFFCKATDVVSILLAKEKMTAICNSDDCENEKAEVEKMMDDQPLINHTITLNYDPASVVLKVTFSYTVQVENEIFKNLFSPPPELV